MTTDEMREKYEIEYRDNGEIYVKGVGKIKSTGKLDMERLVKSLLQCKYITG